MFSSIVVPNPSPEITTSSPAFPRAGVRDPEGTYSIKVSVKGEVVEGLKFTYATPQAPPELAVLQLTSAVTPLIVT